MPLAADLLPKGSKWRGTRINSVGPNIGKALNCTARVVERTEDRAVLFVDENGDYKGDWVLELKNADLKISALQKKKGKGTRMNVGGQGKASDGEIVLDYSWSLNNGGVRNQTVRGTLTLKRQRG